MKLVLLRRQRTRALALAYYRLVRALRTGTTIPGPSDGGSKTTTLTQLRKDFSDLAAPQRATQGPSPSAPPNDTPAPQSAPVAQPGGGADAPSDEEADRIVIEEIERLKEEEDRLAREAEAEARIALEALGPANQSKLIETIDQRRPASEVDALRGQAHDQAGARQAASAERIVLDGARGSLWTYMSRDKRCIGYVRVSRTGTPCGWCAMLISRGPVYRSEESATYKGAASYDDGDKYHDNCHCYAMPVFTREQFDGSDLFELNRKYAEQWPMVTRGLSGKAALSAWRRFIRTEQKSQRAQAVRSPDTSRRRESK